MLRKCLILAVQQGVVFAISFVLVAGMRSLTGVDARSGRVPIGPLEFFAIAALFTAIVFGSRWFFRSTSDPASRDRVLWPTRSGLVDCLIGTVIAFAISGAPRLVAIATGSTTIVETVADRFPAGMLAYVVSVGLVLLVYNSVMEEYASRAFPLALFRESPLLVRIALPALFFAAAHLAVEPFRLVAFYDRFLNGCVLAVAFLLTGNVWLASGVHTGMNLAVLAGSGRWYLGGLARFAGTVPGPDWLVTALWTGVLLAGLAALSVRRGRALPAHEKAPLPTPAVLANSSH